VLKENITKGTILIRWICK